MLFHHQPALAPLAPRGKRPRFVEKQAERATIEFNAQLPKGSIAELVQNRARDLLNSAPSLEDELPGNLRRVSSFCFATRDSLVIAPGGKQPKRCSYYCDGVEIGG